MDTAKELQAKIIAMISNITDIKHLSAIHIDLQARNNIAAEGDETKLPWDNHLAKLREKTDFDYLIATQGVKKMSYEEIQELAGEIAWEQTTDELLAMLD